MTLVVVVREGLGVVELEVEGQRDTLGLREPTEVTVTVGMEGSVAAKPPVLFWALGEIERVGDTLRVCVTLVVVEREGEADLVPRGLEGDPVAESVG